MRPCIACGRPCPGTRCAQCERSHQSKRNARRTQYHGGWQKLSRDTRAAWVAEHGWVCAGIPGHPPHPARDLELDHSTGRVLCHQGNVAAGPAPRKGQAHG